MLKHRLIFGTIMTLGFVGLLLLGGWMDGSISQNANPMIPFKGTVVVILFLLISLPAQLEIKKLFKQISANVFIRPAAVFTMLIGTAVFWMQFIPISDENTATKMVSVISAGIVALGFWSILLIQFLKYRTKNMIINCSATVFAIIYIGFFAGVILAMRVHLGLWAMLMYILTIKATDIGAYTLGKSFGKHKFAPSVSPGKTWEGMFGGVAFAILTALGFAYFTAIMPMWAAVVFAVIMAFAGQFSDLAESMIKRDAQLKDSASSLPGFGGILDVLDSLLLASPIAYCYIWFFSGS